MTKVLTLNTHSWMEENGQQKFQDLLDAILAENYDLICLQEVNQEITSDLANYMIHYAGLEDAPAIHQDHFALKLVEALDEAGQVYYWSWAYNHIGYDRYNEGVAILSKNPIEASSVLVSDVDNEYDYHTRRALVVRTLLGDQEVLAVSTHLSWWDKGFKREWSKLEKALLAQDLPVLIMGDFNNPQGNEGYQLVLASPLKLRDSHVNASQVIGDHTIKADIDGWEGNEHNFKVDYAFTNLPVAIQRSRVVFDGQHYPVVSDHFGLDVTW
ncbi:endonuclease/exonuclease/phosphatase family protein [Streptococcus sp. HF-1907]|uniref:endonuclease/exonuclease/phosphatase family protein n=1 Tax=Streptococcus sp. HF-1907 TaxID=2785793 RepID=UPI00189DED64|nr:endonuclease/exonuclease/phosphatase family protein [Streptococcus sp. HF-1907]MBF7094347.1 endonuclease/exonuclease/phosphatase family protein [Streptococcus sp. HF-1907]